eukprot:4318082-Amphidinium_carterae.1
MGIEEKARKARAAAKRAVSQGNMRTVVEEESRPRHEDSAEWMEVDAENASSAAAASEIASSPAAAAAATSTSTLRAVVAVRGTSREPKGS